MARLADYFIVVGYDHEKTGRCGCAQRCPAAPGRSPRSCPAPAPARLRPGRGRRRLRRARGARPARGGGGEGSGASQGLIPLARGGKRRGSGTDRPGQSRPPGAAAAPSRKRGQVQTGPAAVPGPAAGAAGQRRGCRSPPASRRPGRGSRASRQNKGCARQAAALPRPAAHPSPVERCRGPPGSAAHRMGKEWVLFLKPRDAFCLLGGKGSGVICWRFVGRERVVCVT